MNMRFHALKLHGNPQEINVSSALIRTLSSARPTDAGNISLCDILTRIPGTSSFTLSGNGVAAAQLRFQKRRDAKVPTIGSFRAKSSNHWKFVEIGQFLSVLWQFLAVLSKFGPFWGIFCGPPFGPRDLVSRGRKVGITKEASPLQSNLSRPAGRAGRGA